jgi:hypothetical protein
VADLAAERGHWPAIARAADVSYSTVVAVATRPATNPRIRTLEAIERAIAAVRRSRPAPAGRAELAGVRHGG